MEVYQEYIVDNFKKGFIIFNNTFQAIFVLFIQKANRKFYFYINYWKLNTISKKNQYLLLLIEETILRFAKAYFFIKIDIC